MNLEFSTYFLKILKFHEIPSCGSRVVPFGSTDGRTARHAAANSRFSLFFTTRLINLHDIYIYIYIYIQLVPHRKHYTYVTKTNRWMRYTIIMADYCMNHTEQAYITFCGQNVDFLDVKLCAT